MLSLGKLFHGDENKAAQGNKPAEDGVAAGDACAPNVLKPSQAQLRNESTGPAESLPPVDFCAEEAVGYVPPPPISMDGGGSELPASASYHQPDLYHYDAGDAALSESLIASSPEEDFELAREALLNDSFGTSEMEMWDALEAILNGASFTKFGRRGKARDKLVKVTHEGFIFWSDVTGGKTLNSIRLIDVTNVISGKGTAVFDRKCAKDVPDDVCFSIVTKDRSLDLKADTEETRNTWVEALRFAAKNVQMLGKVCREPLNASSRQEMVEAKAERKVAYLKDKLSQSQQDLFEKNKEIIKREQQLMLERQTSKSVIQQKDEELERIQAEAEALKTQQAELNKKIKVIHHERQASRTVRMGTLTQLQEEVQRLQQVKEEQERKAAEEKEEMRRIIADSQKLLAKAKETIHKRQESRTVHLASIEALQRELQEAHDRNRQLRTEIAATTHRERQARDDIKRAQAVLKDVAASENLEIRVREDDLWGPEEPAREGSSVVNHERQNQHLHQHHGGAGADADAELAAAMSEFSSGDAAGSVHVLRPAVWQPDSEADDCNVCSDEFSFFTRKHHCRDCGLVVCNSCSKTRMELHGSAGKVRVCDTCVSSVTKNLKM